MEETNSTPKSKRWYWKGLKIVALAGGSLLAALYVVHICWVLSGSGRWEFVGEKNGVKVYSLKAPGSELEQVKGVVRVHSTLSGLVAFMQDPDICSDLGCHDARMLERVDDRVQYSSARFDFPFPFRTRELVVRTQTYQNPHTKEVLMWVSAVPDRIPPNPCCVRLTNLNNTWRYTSLGDGEVEVEHVENVNEGGFVGLLFTNRGLRDLMYDGLPRVQNIVSRPKYQNAKVDFIEEQ
jgi:hypothetical protein